MNKISLCLVFAACAMASPITSEDRGDMQGYHSIVGPSGSMYWIADGSPTSQHPSNTSPAVASVTTSSVSASAIASSSQTTIESSASASASPSVTSEIGIPSAVPTSTQTDSTVSTTSSTQDTSPSPSATPSETSTQAPDSSSTSTEAATPSTESAVPAGGEFTGDATYYTAVSGFGACEITHDSPFVVAMNAAQYNKKGNCGKCVQITGARGSAKAQVVDLCPGCGFGALDLNEPLFPLIDDPDKGRVTISWSFVEC
ncbi:hypothetical protein MP228_011365 [Amoeboaphelidium protococcarum]|nr:hypothetical protein MP228_011365 [Amoeboaphelidium protococcarum]